jgi:ATP-binding cassette, subfamily G (WHITE), member 2, PDR
MASTQHGHNVDSSSSEASSVLRQTITAKSEPQDTHPDSEGSVYSSETESTRHVDRAAVSRLASSFSTAAALQRSATVTNLEMSDPQIDPNNPAFDFKLWCKFLMRQLEERGLRRPRVNTTFQDLTVTGTGDEIMIHKTVGSLLMTPLGFATVNKRKQSPKRTILHNFNGTIREGEMCIVLGRPGSGCSTFLKAISGHLEGAKISKDSGVAYNGIPQDVYVKSFRGEILYNQENERHFPHLTVGQTLTFASASRAPSLNSFDMPREKFVDYCVDVALNLYGLSHARHTRVGNDYIRGVSGGERKRVSIAEMALSGALCGTWDNSTRGLDSATALEFVRGLRTSADVTGTSHAVAIYQASQSTYDLFDKATVLYQGRQIYFGPARHAPAYFERMGWQRPSRMTSGDFLTSVTNPTEREARPGFDTKVPRTPEEFEKYWLESPERKACMQELETSISDPSSGDAALKQIQEHHYRTQSKHSRHASPYRISVPAQIRLCIRRCFQRMWNNKPQTMSKVIAQTVQGLIVGSIFYNTPDSTNAFFAKGSVLFCVVLVNTLMSVAEIPALFEQRPIVEKHNQYALYHPASEALAGVIADFPVKMVTSSVFGIIIYFLAGLKTEAGAFFTFYLFTTFTMLTMSACFRSISAASKSNAQAMGLAGIGILAIIIYTGFSIQRSYMQDWLRWISYINPVAYVFEALLASEVHGVQYPCAPQSLVPPYGEGDFFQCAMPGAVQGQKFVLGDSWISSAYGYSFSHLWRNFGILVAFMVVFYALYLTLSELNWKLPSTGEVLVFRRGHAPKQGSSSIEPTEVFTWKDVCYDVPVHGGPRRLLDNITGYVKPGQLTALMGTSGAGKTTLLDTLAKRTNVGVVTGDMLVNGHPVDASFQRKTGYVQQQDVHLSTTTVREALQFSALLRQPRSVSKQEKCAYVEEVIKMLGMEDFAEAIVGSPGEGRSLWFSSGRAMLT